MAWLDVASAHSVPPPLLLYARRLGTQHEPSPQGGSFLGHPNEYKQSTLGGEGWKALSLQDGNRQEASGKL